MKNIFLLFSFVFSQFIFSQEIVKVTRNVGDINSLKVQGKINIILIKSSEEKVEITGKKPSEVNVTNKNGELKISLPTKRLLLSESVDVKVFYRDLQILQASNGAIVKSMKDMSVEKLNLISSGNSLIDLTIYAKELTIKSSSGANILLKGEVHSQNIKVYYAGKYSGKELKSSKTDIKVSTKGVAEIFVTDVLKSRARTGGSIIVYGNPNNRKDRKTSLGGEILFLR